LEIRRGSTLGHYRLIDKIGEGGMGVVWRATDTTLDRDVAIKVLPEALAADSDRLVRFEREAKLLASLNHPHIAAVYGLHEQDGVRFIAMELVDGEDLAETIARGPLGVPRVLEIARAIAEALEAAHEQGVIHRDLKPANVRLTPDGKVKVLDFGLAKAYDPSTASAPAHSQAITSAGTVAGLILGTAAYMSPEQASGQPTDRRCDIWSFGVVLHELLTGRRMFHGETISHTMADVLRAPIDLGDLPSDLPPGVRRLIERCLDRDRMRRLRDIGEARIALEDAIANPDRPPMQGGPAVPVRSPARFVPWVVAALAIVVAVVGLTGQSRPPAQSGEPTRRFVLDVPNSGNTRQGEGVSVAISSDGRSIVTRGDAGADDMLYMRAIDDFEPRAIEGTVDGRRPHFSPDDRWIAFLDATGLRKVRVSGGPATFIARTPSAPDGMHWGPDDTIYYSHQGDIWRVSSEGGEPERVYGDETGEGGGGFEHPFLAPDETTLLCNSRSAPGEPGELHALDLPALEMKSLGVQGTDPRYLPTGHLLFVQSGKVFVAPFDLDAARLTGTPVPVLDRAWVDQSEAQLAVSTDGTVVYLPNTRGESQTLVKVGMDGKALPLLTETLPFASLNDPRVSHDGRRMMVSVEGGAIWMLDLDTQTPTLMTESGFYPLWNPNGEEIVFSTARNKTFDVYRRPVDLSRPETLLLDTDNNMRTGDWTRQGHLVIREEIPGKGMDLRFWPETDDESTMVPLLEGPDDELAPVVSPDGEWLAYVSNYSGNDEIYVTSFPKPGAKLKISVKGGNSPTWSPDGRTLYYLEGIRMIAVSIETEPRFRVTGRETLFEGNYVQYRWSRQHDIFPDGSGFVMIRNPPRGNVEVVTRWFDDLRALDD
jgi:serine/threonine-protein kinase